MQKGLGCGMKKILGMQIFLVQKSPGLWIDSIFEAQNICFGSEIASLLDHSDNKYVLLNTLNP